MPGLALPAQRRWYSSGEWDGLGLLPRSGLCRCAPQGRAAGRREAEPSTRAGKEGGNGSRRGGCLVGDDEDGVALALELVDDGVEPLQHVQVRLPPATRTTA